MQDVQFTAKSEWDLINTATHRTVGFCRLKVSRFDRPRPVQTGLLLSKHLQSQRWRTVCLDLSAIGGKNAQTLLYLL